MLKPETVTGTVSRIQATGRKQYYMDQFTQGNPSGHYQVTIKVTGETNKPYHPIKVNQTIKVAYFARHNAEAIDTAWHHLDRIARAKRAEANGFTVKITKVECFGSRKDDWRYDPNTTCDDCGMVAWKGHNYSVEH